jgi:CRISPR-associated RAMP protein (TIGR02581 family)
MMAPSDFRFRSHDTLERLLAFELRLTCRTGLHIGAGKSAEMVGSDLPVMRDASGRPLLPGSSLRGVLRAGIESLANGLSLERARPAVLQAVPGDRGPEIRPEEEWAKWTLVERLFGRIHQKKDPSPCSFASRLQLSDLVSQAPEGGEVIVELRDGVGIDRETRTAANGVKYDLEVVPAGTQFTGRVRFKNPVDYEVGLLAQVLWMLDEGLLLVGGKSARGLGWMQVEVTAPRVATALELLQHSPLPVRLEYGPVGEHFSTYLASLAGLAETARQSPVVQDTQEAR